MEKSKNWLLALAVFGLTIPNGIFIYYATTQPWLMNASSRNPVSVVFIAEAFVLMILGSYIAQKAIKKPFTWLKFILFSLIGSMLFSAPLFVWKYYKGQDSK